MTGRSTRIEYLDWLRGLAVLIMMFWHSIDSWSTEAAHHADIFSLVVFIGGWAAPLFIFLAGVSVSLAGESRSLNGGRRAAGLRLQTRGWEIFALAHVFRLQSFVLNPLASWSSLLKPDILNILGLGLVAAAWCWIPATTRVKQIVYLLGPAAFFVMLAPASRLWTWPALVRPFAPRFEAYIRPVAGMGVFSLFPWLGFVFVGAFVGCVIAARRVAADESALHLRLTGASLAIIAAGIIGRSLPSLTSSSFWTTSLSFFLMRTGVMILGIPLARVWMRFALPRGSTPLVVFGRASLFVYWVHVELAYGFLSQPLHGALSLPQALVGFAMLALLMFGLTHLWTQRRRPMVPVYLRVTAT